MSPDRVVAMSELAKNTGPRLGCGARVYWVMNPVCALRPYADFGISETGT
jgi:hypothetical protein